MNLKPLFTLAKEEGLSALEVRMSKSKSLSFNLFHREVDSYSIEETCDYVIRGILNNKFGVFNTNTLEKKDFSFIISEIKKNAQIIEKEEDAIIFKGSPKYKKKNVFNPAISNISIEEKMANLHKIEDKLVAFDERISKDAEVQYVEDENEYLIENSYGLKLKAKTNYFLYIGGCTAKGKDGNVQSGNKFLFSNNPKDLNIDEFVKDTANDALRKLEATSIDSKKCPVVFNSKTTASLLNFFIASTSAESVQKHSSLLQDKLHSQVASKKITVTENPLNKNCFYRYFDDEGVATYNKTIIKKGVLETFLYNLETAKKDGVETTGNGYGGGKIGVDNVNLILKPGKKSEEELISQVKDGVYITELSGMNAGINSMSGNFSLLSTGFVIREGKIAEPINLFTTAGNLIDLFMNIKEVANNLELHSSSTSAPSILVKKLSISGN